MLVAGADINLQDKSGNSVYSWATSAGNIRVVEMLQEYSTG